MIILVDMDDTTYVWNKTKDKLLQQDYPHLTQFKFGKDVVSWDLFEGLDDEHKGAMLELMNRKGFYLNLKPITGAVTALKMLEKRGHQILFVSTPWVSNEWCMYEKFLALERDFGKGWGDKLVLTRDKTIVTGDLLVDDKPEITGINRKPTWTRVLFTQPHNAKVEGHRIDKWNQYEYLENILAAA